MSIQNRYVELGEGRNEIELKGSAIHYDYRTDTNRGEVKRKVTFDVFSKESVNDNCLVGKLICCCTIHCEEQCIVQQITEI